VITITSTFAAADEKQTFTKDENGNTNGAGVDERNAVRANDPKPTSSSDGGNSHNPIHKIPTINKLFRSGSSGHHHKVGNSSSVLNSIPVIPKLNFANNTNATTATVTLPLCDGLRGGPCLDKTTGQIIP
jgi:hypothetical protein